jgi:hypothetical protein
MHNSLLYYILSPTCFGLTRPSSGRHRYHRYQRVHSLVSVTPWWWPREAETCRREYIIKKWIVHVLEKLLQSCKHNVWFETSTGVAVWSYNFWVVTKRLFPSVLGQRFGTVYWYHLTGPWIWYEYMVPKRWSRTEGKWRWVTTRTIRLHVIIKFLHYYV